MPRWQPVSYTHLDVYKRQGPHRPARKRTARRRPQRRRRQSLAALRRWK
ncbi:hypothetical protein [Arthrobacter sp. KBS0703]|nr:hypothetical protein [Arthrobacter sp. KBS0703]